MTMTSSTIFPADALDTNRSGTLTADQTARLRRFARLNRGTQLMMGGVLAVSGAFLWRGAAPAPQAWWTPWAGVAVIAIGAMTALHALGIGNRLVRDLRDGRVLAIEGAISKRRDLQQSRSVTPRTHHLIVEGQWFAVGPAGFDAAPDAGYVRLFYLPRSHRAVNLERLPARVSTREVLANPAQALESFAARVLSPDRTTRAEALADAADVTAAWSAGQQQVAAAAHAAARDPRPLAEAILGTWSMGGLLTVEFRADGTALVRPALGAETRGRWAVDGSGRLRSNVTGDDQVGDASIAGDVLTLSSEETTLSFQRVRE